MTDWAVALVALALLGYSLAASRLAHSVVTGPMVFTAVGLLFGPEAFDVVEFDLDTQFIEVILSATLALVLFTDATRIELATVVRYQSIPGRLLVIALPLVIVAGTAAAIGLFSELDLLVAALVGAVLAPTDAALGQAVVTNERVPERVRQSLSIESGLNDGIALPIVTVLLALALSDQGSVSGSFVVETLVKELGIGIVVGIAIGSIAGRVITEFRTRGWLSGTWLSIAVLMTPALAFGVADPLHGSGFVATFVAGLLFGRKSRGSLEHIVQFTDDIAQMFVLGTFLIYGGAILSDEFGSLDLSIVVYAALSLTVVRMVPTALALIGTGFHPRTVFFMGWFGPRGLASILFVVIIIEDSPELQGLDRLSEIVAWTVAFSILLHGVSAWPGSNRYARWVEHADERGDELPEAEPVPHETAERYYESSGESRRESSESNRDGREDAQP